MAFSSTYTEETDLLPGSLEAMCIVNVLVSFSTGTQGSRLIRCPESRGTQCTVQVLPVGGGLAVPRRVSPLQQHVALRVATPSPAAPHQPNCLEKGTCSVCHMDSRTSPAPRAPHSVQEETLPKISTLLLRNVGKASTFILHAFSKLPSGSKIK